MLVAHWTRHVVKWENKEGHHMNSERRNPLMYLFPFNCMTLFYLVYFLIVGYGMSIGFHVIILPNIRWIWTMSYMFFYKTIFFKCSEQKYFFKCSNYLSRYIESNHVSFWSMLSPWWKFGFVYATSKVECLKEINRKNTSRWLSEHISPLFLECLVLS